MIKAEITTPKSHKKSLITEILIWIRLYQNFFSLHTSFQWLSVTFCLGPQELCKRTWEFQRRRLQRTFNTMDSSIESVAWTNRSFVGRRALRWCQASSTGDSSRKDTMSRGNKWPTCETKPRGRREIIHQREKRERKRERERENEREGDGVGVSHVVPSMEQEGQHLSQGLLWPSLSLSLSQLLKDSKASKSRVGRNVLNRRLHKNLSV